MTRKELDAFLKEECELSDFQIATMSPEDKIDEVLMYNGIIGYTDDIIELVKASGLFNK